MESSFSMLAALGIALVCGMIGLPTLICLSNRFDLLDHPGRHKRHSRPTPYLGGVGLFVAVWVAVIAVRLLHPEEPMTDPRTLALVFAGAVIITGMGLIDDRRPLPAVWKLIIQVGVGVLLYQGGLRAEYMVWPTGEVEIGTVSLFVTIGWVVVVTNAINLIDGLDGLAAGVSLIACATLIVIGMLREVGWVLVLLTSMAGFLMPFLYYNRHPARIFLGDSGSLQIGYYFAAFSLLVNFKSFAASALFIPLLVLGVPLIETLTSFSRRLATGRNVMTADRRHIFHYLALAGLSPRGVVLVFYALGLVFGLFALAMFYWSKLLVLGILIGFMIAITVAFYIMVTRLPDRLRSGRGSSEPTDRGD